MSNDSTIFRFCIETDIDSSMFCDSYDRIIWFDSTDEHTVDTGFYVTLITEFQIIPYSTSMIYSFEVQPK